MTAPGDAARPPPRPEIWIDRGGTFTDCVLRDPASGRFSAVKVLSSAAAPLEGIRLLLGLGPGEPLPPCDVRLGTTLVTNALLERRFARTLLVVTRGFGDILAIGDQTRPELFALRVERPPPLHEAVLEVDARIGADGAVLARPDRAGVLRSLAEARACGLESAAVLVVNSHLDGTLERELGALCGEAGFEMVALSHEVTPRIGLVLRGETTVLHAALTPELGRQLGALEGALAGGSLRVLQSSGGLTGLARLRAPHAALSGPAGGVVAVARLSRALALGVALGLDMGGTSTDVCRVAGAPELTERHQIAGRHLHAPAVDVHTVAAGGGSLCRVDGLRLVVGPESAGADPGPLCYGRAGAEALTVTDVSLLLGRIPARRFPFPLDLERARDGLCRARDALASAGIERTLDEVAQGFLDVAVHSMAEAIREVSVARGHGLDGATLVAFGGAAGQHACAVADALGLRRVVVPPLPGVFSALGVGLAPVTFEGEREGTGRAPEDSVVEIRAGLDALEAEGRLAALGDAGADARFTVTRVLALRYRGTETAIDVTEAPPAEAVAAFESAHQRLFGYSRRGASVEVAALRVRVVADRAGEATTRPVAPSRPDRAPARTATTATCRLFVPGSGWQAVPELERAALAPTDRVEGPAVLVEETTAVVVERGWAAELLAEGSLLLQRVAAPAAAELARRATGPQPDPAELEILGRRFLSIATRMGEVLRRTAQSTNIRERLDFSCALFDATGGLVANAPHVPVHLGAMSESVRAVLAAHPHPTPGDVFATNDPSQGGSHLPDITVVTPVHGKSGEVAFVVASRGHHADVGGRTPGSMPPDSTRIEHEGVLLSALRVVSGGQLRVDALRAALHAGPYPARAPETNIADLEAQIAANRLGARLVEELARERGERAVRDYMAYVQDDAAAAVERALAGLPAGETTASDALDDGTALRIRVTTGGPRLLVDFTGTAAEHPGNLNAPRAVTVAAVLYVLRLLADRPIPLNGGCLRAVRLVLPAPGLLCPGPGRAVAAGNVETSQRVVDLLLAALGLAAASQGTMNNLTFGDGAWGYYETIGGGTGAGPGWRGASAVQSHMTNTRLTDVEILEARYPVRVRELSIRRGSGGAGAFPGGDGMVREIELLAPLDVAVLADRRVSGAPGLAGGRPGAPGRTLRNGQPLPGRVSFRGVPGDRLRIETPGGGGYGPA